ncbi:MAG: FAD-dependent monooxygenase [Gammaproteobacteria bacterium]|nr:FAD-dependent monooxygenase [Gammaproteobacteria bacterium]
MASGIDIPVLVVGGGASGTMLSLQLSRYGTDFRTIDRLPAPSPTSRAITVHSRMLEIFELLDKDLAAQFIDRGIPDKGYDLHYVRDGKRHVVEMGIDFTTTDCRYPFLLIHRQDETEKALRDYWKQKYNGEAQWGKKLVSVEQDGDCVSSVIEDTQTGAQETIRSTYVIACDGINSQVRRCLDVEQDESNYQGTVLQNLDIRLNNFPDAKDHIHYCAGTDHFMMVAYLPGDFYRLLVSDRGEAADPDATPEENIQKLMDLHFDGVSMGERVWHSKWESWVRLAKTYRENNVFLVGDSAHVHSTTGGQGVNCCIQDAWNLGWKLGMVESGLANVSLLESYEAERRPIAEQVIWAASSLHETFMGHGKDISERGEQMEDPAYLEKVVGCCSGISYTYRDTIQQYPELEALQGPAIGDRAPDADLENGQSLFRLLGDTRFTLLASGLNDEQSEMVAALAENYPKILKLEVLDNSPAFNARYQTEGKPVLFLVRPDGYIGFRCLANETDALENFLSELVRPN